MLINRALGAELGERITVVNEEKRGCSGVPKCEQREGKARVSLL